jgi:hypothetical protein
MGQRPVSITVLCVVGLVFAAFGVFGTCWGVVGNFTDFSIGDQTMIKPLKASTAYLVYVGVSAFTAMVLNTILIASCVGSLKLRPWGRTGMNAYAMLSILQTILVTIITMVWIVPVMFANMPASMPPEVRKGAQIGFYLTPVCSLVQMAYPVLVLIFFNRTVARNAFRGIFVAERTNFPVTQEEPQQPNP